MLAASQNAQDPEACSYTRKRRWTSKFLDAYNYPAFVEDGLDELLSEGSSEFAAALQPLNDLYLTILEIAFP